MSVKIALLQVRPMPDFDSAIDEAIELASQVDPDTKMLMLPEYCSGFKVVDGKFAPPSAPAGQNPMLQALCRHARENKVWILAGSLAIPAASSSVEAKIHNCGFVIDDLGTLRSHYNKIHLFDIQLSADEVYKESDIVIPGQELSMIDTPVGLLGHTICYDLRFPQLYRDLSKAGAEILAIPAAFTKATGEAHWHALCRARAIENGAYVVAPCSIGPIEGGGGAYGHSLVVDPWGEIVVDGGETRGVVHADIDLAKVTDARRRIPSLQHDLPYRSASDQPTAAGRVVA